MVYGTAVIIVSGFIIFAATVFKDIGINMMLNTDAILIIAGGTITALFIGFPFSRIREAFGDIIESFRNNRQKEHIVGDILDIAKTYRMANIKALELKARSIKNDFLRLGITLILNNHRDEEIKGIMTREMAARLVNYNFSRNILKTISRLTPSLGLAGTVISLIKMFKGFQSVDAMAPLMAVALMSTFYGVVISNLLVLPLSAKIRDRAIEEESLMRLTIEGIIAVNNREHPLKVEEKIIYARRSKEFYTTDINNAVAVKGLG